MAITAQITDASRALHVLEGVLKGIACDDEINPAEVAMLQAWLDNHKSFSHIYPFCDAYQLIENIVEDGVISRGEQEELLDFCLGFEALEGPIDTLTKEMRNLHGFMHGIIADGKVSTQELQALEQWMLYHQANCGKWPFDQVYGVVRRILADGVVTEAEQKEFIDLVSGFAEVKAVGAVKDKDLFAAQWLQSNAPVLKTIDGIIDHGCEIVIAGRVFCCTGIMRFGKRKDMHAALVRKGGIVSDGVTKKTDYLVIGGNSNPCWVYSTWSSPRKVDTKLSAFLPIRL